MLQTAASDWQPGVDEVSPLAKHSVRRSSVVPDSGVSASHRRDGTSHIQPQGAKKSEVFCEQSLRQWQPDETSPEPLGISFAVTGPIMDRQCRARVCLHQPRRLPRMPMNALRLDSQGSRFSPLAGHVLHWARWWTRPTVEDGPGWRGRFIGERLATWERHTLGQAD